MKNTILIALIIYSVAMTFLYYNVNELYKDTADYKTKELFDQFKDKVNDVLD